MSCCGAENSKNQVDQVSSSCHNVQNRMETNKKIYSIFSLSSVLSKEFLRNVDFFQKIGNFFFHIFQHTVQYFRIGQLRLTPSVISFLSSFNNSSIQKENKSIPQQKLSPPKLIFLEIKRWHGLCYFSFLLMLLSSQLLSHMFYSVK